MNEPSFESFEIVQGADLRRQRLWRSNRMNTISVRGVPVDQVSQVKLGVKEVDRHLHVLGGQVHVHV